MTTDEDQGQHAGDDEPAVPERPETRQAETVEALEDEQSGDSPDDGERVSGDDVTENPDADEMEGLPGPPSGDAGEPTG